MKPFHDPFYFVVATLLWIPLISCSNPAGIETAHVPMNSADFTPAFSSALGLRPPTSKTSLVYVSDDLGGGVNVYDALGLDQVPIQSIRNLDKPLGLWVDAQQNVYVAESGKDRVLAFGPGATKPYLSLKDPKPPAAVCGDTSGTIYVPDAYANGIEIYAGGATKPTGRITDTNAQSMGFCQVDQSGDLFVSYSDGSQGGLDEFAAGATVPSSLICCLASVFPGFVLYGKSDLIIQTGGDTCSFSIYERPYTRGPKKSVACYGSAFQIALDATQKHLWTADFDKRTADEYQAQSLMLVDSTSSTDLAEPVGVALSPAAAP